MSSFFAPQKELENIYESQSAELFALCYLYTARSNQATLLMSTVLSDMAYREKSFNLAKSGRDGFFRVSYLSCMDYFRSKMRKLPKEEVLRKSNVPFAITDILISILKLPIRCKAPLFFRLRLGYSAEETAKILRKSPASVNRSFELAMKTLGKKEREIKKSLFSLVVGGAALQRVWDRFLLDCSEKGYGGKQHLRFFKRGMDMVIPFAALGVIVFCVMAYLTVHFGWLGTSFEKSTSFEGYAPQSLAPDDPIYKLESRYAPASEDSLPIALGDVSVYVPTEDGINQREYIVKDTPLSAEAVSTQMVFLGGMPEGSSLISAETRSNGTESTDGSIATYSVGDYFSLNLEFSKEVADYFATSKDTSMMRAMVRTFVSYSILPEGYDEIHFLYEGKEMTSNGSSAQDFLNDKPEISNITETNYRKP